MEGYLCEDTIEGIFTGIYHAWEKDPGHTQIRLLLKEQYEPELFFHYTDVIPDPSLAEKVARSIRKKISAEAFQWVYRCAMSDAPDRADAIYRFLVDGFRYGGKILRMLQLPSVRRMFDLDRKVQNEAHRFLQFIRFEELSQGILFATIAPKSSVLTLVAPHFEARFSGENWIIFDEAREICAVHEALHPYSVAALSKKQASAFLNKYRSHDSCPDLWKIFFHTIGIESRENKTCQRNFLPLWYRKHMTEFL